MSYRSSHTRPKDLAEVPRVLGPDQSKERPPEPRNIRLRPLRLPEMEPIKGRGFNQNGPAS